jgi:hypothetical protein
MFDVFAELLPLLCSFSLFSFAPLALFLTFTQGNCGAYYSRGNVCNEAFDALNFTVTPALTLIEAPPSVFEHVQLELSREFMRNDSVIIPAVCRIGYPANASEIRNCSM